MKHISCAPIMLLIGLLRLTNATPACPTAMTSNTIKIGDQKNLNETIWELISAQYNQSKCVTLLLNKENYKINLVELLKINGSNFVIIGGGLKRVRLDCADAQNADTNHSLSDLEYVGFHRLAFYGCKIPLWVENVASFNMEEVTFRWVLDVL